MLIRRSYIDFIRPGGSNLVNDPLLSINPVLAKSVIFTYWMKLIRSILALTLAFLVLFASTSFIVGVHHCGGELRGVALFSKADPCPMEKQAPPCHRAMNRSCCEDNEVFHEGQAFKSVAPALDFSAPFVGLNQSTEVFIADIINEESAPASYPGYNPPFLADDITISLQVFLL